MNKCLNCGRIFEEYSNVGLCEVCYSQAFEEYEKLLSELYE